MITIITHTYFVNRLLYFVLFTGFLSIGYAILRRGKTRSIPVFPKWTGVKIGWNTFGSTSGAWNLCELMPWNYANLSFNGVDDRWSDQTQKRWPSFYHRNTYIDSMTIPWNVQNFGEHVSRSNFLLITFVKNPQSLTQSVMEGESQSPSSSRAPHQC